MKKIVFFVFSSIIVFTTTLFVRLGGFKPVDIELSDYPNLHLAYKEHLGPYHKIAGVITEVETWVGSQHLSCDRTFGEYLDDPRTTDERRLQSNGGCIIDATSALTLEKSLKVLRPSNDPIASDIKIKAIPAKKYLLARFTGAPSIGPFKVYPKVEKYMREHNLKSTGAVFEIYTIKNNSEATTEYLFSYDYIGGI